jgi:tetratricopeptide (TPR) repeat protein
MRERARDVALAVALAALAAVLYLPTLDDPWHFDDRAELEWPGVRQFAPEIPPGSYRGGVVLWSWALDYRRSGEDPRAFHATNVAVHAACVVLVFALALALGRGRSAGDRGRGTRASRGEAALAAAIFAVHPIAIQSVAYVTQRSTSIAALFLLGTLVGWWEFRRADRGRIGRAVALIASLVCYQLGLHAKHVAAIAPAVLIAAELGGLVRSDRGRDFRTALAPLAAYVLLAAFRFRTLAPAVRRRIERAFAPPVESGPLEGTAFLDPGWSPVGPLDPAEYLATQCRVIVTYLRQLVFPSGLGVDPAVEASRSLAEPAVLVSAALLVAIAVLAWRGRRRAPLASLGAALFFLGLAPTSSFVPSPDLAFEHRVYVPLVGFAVAAATGILAIGRCLGRPGPAVLAVPVLVALAVTTHVRLRVWDSDLALWADASAKSPEKIRPRFNLALALQEAGRDAEAEREYERVLARQPGHPLALNNLGNLLRARGEVRRAIPLYEDALAQAPHYFEARLNLGNAYLDLGDPDGAAARYREVLERDPEHFAARYNLGKIHESRGEWTAAIAEYERARDARPADSRAWNDLGCAQLQVGRVREAVESLEEAARISGGEATVRYNLALAREADGDVAGAIRELEAVLDRDPTLGPAVERLRRLRTSGETRR